MKSLLMCSLLLAGSIYAQPKLGDGSIEGHVYNALTGVPVRKATVTLSASQMLLTAETNVEGGFRFTGLPAGSYRPTAKQAGYLERAARRSVALADGQHTQKVDIQLVPQAAISGLVLDEDGDPVGGATVQIYKRIYQEEPQQWERMNVSISTNEAGEYRIANLSSGRYLIQVQNPRGAINAVFGERPQMLTTGVYYPNAVTEATAAPVEAVAGKESRGIDVRLFRIPQPRLFHVRGRVVGAPPGAQVAVSRGFPVGPPDYAFDVEVPAGEQILSANTPTEPYAFARSTVNVSSDMKDVILTLNPAPTVTGRVRVAEQDAVVDLKGLRVTLQPTTHSFRNDALSEANGKLVFGSLTIPGRHVVVVDPRSLPKGCFVQKIMAGGREISAEGLDIQSSLDIEVVLSSTAATIAGLVAEEDGTQFGGSIVTLISADGKILRQIADEKGNFTLKNVGPGKYKLLAWDNVEEFVWQEAESRKKYEGRALDVNVAPSDEQSVKIGAITAEDVK